MKIVLFEDSGFENLYPLTYLRPVFELRCGAFTLKERIERKFPDATLYVETREALKELATESYGESRANNPNALRPDDDILLVNAGAILTCPSESYPGQDRIALNADGELVWAFLKKETVAGMQAGSAAELAQKATEALPSCTTEDILVRYPWDLIEENAEQIARDFRDFFQPAVNSRPMKGAEIAGDHQNLFVDEGVEIQPHTFIDCRNGPVILTSGVTVHAHTSIHAPAYIGRDTQLFEAKIREGCSIGPVCRVGGEVEESIIHAYSNKYHTGFLGHSYVCEWVNLGALTTNSDLKNDYSTVKVYLNGNPVDTGSIKVGSFIGDHTKTSIGTLLNTGTIIGIMCNLMAGSGPLPKYIPSFCWYLQDRISKGLGLGAALATARAAMGRRKRQLSPAMERLIRYTESLTKQEKMEKVRRDRKRLR